MSIILWFMQPQDIVTGGGGGGPITVPTVFPGIVSFSQSANVTAKFVAVR